MKETVNPSSNYFWAPGSGTVPGTASSDKQTNIVSGLVRITEDVETDIEQIVV